MHFEKGQELFLRSASADCFEMLQFSGALPQMAGTPVLQLRFPTLARRSRQAH